MMMTISAEPFIKVQFSFDGKETLQDRAEHVADIAHILETEYQAEITARGGPVEFYYEAGSCSDYMEFTDFDLKAFDIKLQAERFIKQHKLSA